MTAAARTFIGIDVGGTFTDCVQEEGVEALAVSFLWSFANPTHEEQAVSAIGELYPGVVQRGDVAYAQESGAPLARALRHWTDGCPVVEERRWADSGPDVIFRSYLDPCSGRTLHVEVTLAGEPRSFEVSPHRWTSARG
jgi:hypothetical protein